MKLSSEQIWDVKLKLVDKFKNTDFSELLMEDGMKETQKYSHHPDYGIISCIIREVYPFIESILLNKPVREETKDSSPAKSVVRVLLEEDCPVLFNFIWTYVEIKEMENKGIEGYELPEAHDKYAT